MYLASGVETHLNNQPTASLLAQSTGLLGKSYTTTPPVFRCFPAFAPDSGLLVDTVLSWNNDRPLTFNRTVDLLVSSQQRDVDRNGERRQDNIPSAFAAETQARNRQDSIISDPDNIYAQASQPMSSRPQANRTNRTCFRCGSTSHVITDCTAPAPPARTNQKPTFEVDNLPPTEPMDHQNESPTNPNFSNLEFDEPATEPHRQRDMILDTG
ncbi:hypothetical protein KEM48_007278 [Puccinia striiformis f. sp. tritici PST-130]|nr:hypothetical protein KEM48_007278 [Puccinia striiformis f. sp. tritici PST-130]